MHYGVTNVLGQYPKTASIVRSGVVTPRFTALARDPDHPKLAAVLNVADGQVVHEEVRVSLGFQKGR